MLKTNIYKPSEAKSIIFDYKNKGKKVIFTNGCFDIIHKGHKTYLKAAKKLTEDFLDISNCLTETNFFIKKNKNGRI